MIRKVTIIQVASVVSLIFLITPICLYCIEFGTLGLSGNLETWAHFSDFFMLWISVASLIMIVALTYYISILDLHRENERRKIDDARNRPILVLQTDSANYKIIKNIGIGPALNVRVTIKTEADTYLPAKVVTPIMAGESQKLSLMAWFGTDYPTICFVYQDILNNFITTETDKDDTTKILFGVNVLQ